MILFQEGKLSVRVLTDEDASQLSTWLSDERVLAYYECRDRPHDLDLVKKHFYNTQDNLSRCIIQYEQQEIGYIQFYPIDVEEREKYGYINESEIIFGMDQFIGEVEFWDKGIGTKLINATVEKRKLLEKHEWNEGEYRDCWLIEFANE